MMNVPQITLSNGQTIPGFGLGTYEGPIGREHEVAEAVKHAVDIGYRHFDCAHVYKNENVIGNAIAEKIAEGVVKREDLFVTGKLWCNSHRPDLVEPAIKQTLQDLRMDYVDLYLMHWPYAFKEGPDLLPKDPNNLGAILFSDVDYVDTWKAMEALVEKGYTKSIGISNFNSQQINRLLKHAKILPVMNQIECHAYFNQKKLREFCSSKSIAVTAYCPLSRPHLKTENRDVLNDARLKTIAGRYRKTVAQVLLRFHIQMGTIPIPKSANKHRLAENISIFDFKLSDEDMEYLYKFDCNERICVNSFASNHPHYPFKSDIEY